MLLRFLSVHQAGCHRASGPGMFNSNHFKIKAKESCAFCPESMTKVLMIVSCSNHLLAVPVVLQLLDQKEKCTRMGKSIKSASQNLKVL